MFRVALHTVVALTTFLIGITVAVSVKPLINPSEITILNADEERKPTASLSEGSAEQEILDIMRQYDVAQTRLDASFFEGIEADSFVVNLRDGGILTKAQVIALMKTWDGKTQYKHEDLQVQLYGNSAIVTGWMTANGFGEESQLSTRWKSIYLFVKRDGRWQILSTTQVN